MNSAQIQNGKQKQQAKIKKDLPQNEQKVEKKESPKMVKNPLMSSSPLSRNISDQKTLKSEVKITKVPIAIQKEVMKMNEQPQIVKMQSPSKQEDNQKKVSTFSKQKQCEARTPIASKELSTIEDILFDKALSVSQSSSPLHKSRRDLNDVVSEQKEPVFKVKHPVIITVTEVIQKGKLLSKSITYQLKGQDNYGPFTIQRRQTQFLSLRQLLKERWPGSFIPSMVFKSDIKVDAKRQRQTKKSIQNFVLGLSYSQHLYYKQQVQLFLRSPQISIEQIVQKMPVLKAKDIVERYIAYVEQAFMQNRQKTQNVLKETTQYLGKNMATLKQMVKKVWLLCQSYQVYSKHVSKFGQCLKTYQRQCLSSYISHNHNKTIIVKDQTKNIDKLKIVTHQNPFYRVYNSLNNQINDLQSFLGTIQCNQLFILKCHQISSKVRELEEEINQINSGHSTLKTVATRKSKEEVLAECLGRQKKLIKNQYSMNQLYIVTSSFLANVSVPIFKKFKLDCYRSMLQEWSTMSSELLPEVVGVWELIQAEAKILLK